MARTRIGISGWRYTPWRGTFYPAGLPQRLELQYAAGHLGAIEINGSFYSLQRPESYAAWFEQTPPDFMFAVKGPRFITHMKKLRDVEIPLANFLASGVFNLRHKLGPILWQFPPAQRYDPERFEAFFKLLPMDTAAAERLARQHDARWRGRVQLDAGPLRRLQHAIEIRHTSFLTPEFPELLRRYNIALVIAETARKWPLVHDITADFIYMRLHGDKVLYRSGYSDRALQRWARRIRAWQSGAEPADARCISPRRPGSQGLRDVYCFFDNTDVKLRAPFDAQALMRKLQLTAPAQSEALELIARYGTTSRPRVGSRARAKAANKPRDRTETNTGNRPKTNRGTRSAARRGVRARAGAR